MCVFGNNRERKDVKLAPSMESLIILSFLIAIHGFWDPA